MIYLLALIGLVMLVAGGDFLVRGAVTIAERLGVSSLIIGLTVVGFGTSLPELVTSLQAAGQGADGLSIGNVVGSNIANILLILGVSALICPFMVDKDGFAPNASALCLSTAACVALCAFDAFSRPSGIALIVVLFVYLAYAIRTERSRLRQSAAQVDATTPMLPIENPDALVVGTIPSQMPRAIALVVLGLVSTLVGANLLVDNAIQLAKAYNVSDATIGATVVAIGTSLPELATCAVAAAKKQVEIAFGNIVGSNLFNVFGILGVTAAAYPLTVPQELLKLDVWFLAGATAALLAMIVAGYRISRLNGVVLLAGYVAFISLVISRA